jgi:phosphoglycerol transferase MdoB-like AlkP superfamily enzyme
MGVVMGSIVYIANGLIFALCAILLLRGFGRVRQRLLLWSGLCFTVLSLSNFLIFVDLVLTPSTVDLFPLRLVVAAIATSLLVFGLIWESDQLR